MSESKAVIKSKRKLGNAAAKKKTEQIQSALTGEGDTSRGGLGGAARQNAASRSGEAAVAEKAMTMFGGGVHPKFRILPLGKYKLKKKKKENK